MTDQPTPPADTAPGTAAPSEEEQRVPYERFQQATRKAREAADRAKTLEREMQELRQQLEDRETAGMPELDQLKQQLAKATSRAEDAEKRASEQEQAVRLAQRERWVTAAATKLRFVDPDDAARYVDLSEIEDARDAERAVKRVADAKKHLIAPDEPAIPGQVLQNGRPATANAPGSAAPGSAVGLIGTEQEAAAVSEALRAFREQRKPTQITFGA